MSDEVANPKISVVVPVYKVEKYLRECVESVLAQSFGDFELLLVDDGSPDRSGEICDELAKKDSRVRVFHQKNCGVTSARKFGVEQARGEWINFVDSDDLLPKDSLKNLIAEATDDTDLVQGYRQVFNGNAPKVKPSRTDSVKIFDTIGIAELMLSIHMGPWTKLVRKKLFTPNVFEMPREIRLHVDTLMNMGLVTNKPRRPKEIDTVVYYLRRDSVGSICHSNVATEKYVLRYAKLLFAKVRKISTLETKERLSHVLSRFLCEDIAHLMGYRLPIKFPHRLATLMHRGAKEMPRRYIVYLCLRFNCIGVARLLAKIFSVLKGRKFDVRGKTLLE